MDKEAKQAERQAERERRMARIRNAGSSRLQKITTSASTQDFKEPVPQHTPTASAPREFPRVLNTSNVASCSANSVTESMTKEMDPRNDSLLDFLAQNASKDDPLLSLLQPQQTQPAQGQQTQQQQKGMTLQQRDRVNRGWEALHLALALAVGLYAAFRNPWNAGMLFVTIEIAQFAAQLVLGHVRTGLPAMIMPFIGMLPRNRQKQLNMAGALVFAARTAYRDFAVTLVAFGGASLGGRNFNPLIS